MQETLSKEFIRTLAAANGLTIPEERLELVLRQYEGFLRTLREINSLSIPMETEPAFACSLPSQPPPAPAARRGE